MGFILTSHVAVVGANHWTLIGGDHAHCRTNGPVTLCPLRQRLEVSFTSGRYIGSGHKMVSSNKRQRHTHQLNTSYRFHVSSCQQACGAENYDEDEHKISLLEQATLTLVGIVRDNTNTAAAHNQVNDPEPLTRRDALAMAKGKDQSRFQVDWTV